MTILSDLKRLENENRLLENLLRHALETSALLRKDVRALMLVCPLLREIQEKEEG